jgi:hypothetical protein
MIGFLLCLDTWAEDIVNNLYSANRSGVAAGSDPGGDGAQAEEAVPILLSRRSLRCR